VGGVANSAPADTTLIRLLVRGQKIAKRMFEPNCPPIEDIAHEQKLTPSYATRLVRLTFLAPDIVAAVLAGKQPAGLTANKLMADTRLPLDWRDQCAALGFASSPIVDPLPIPSLAPEASRLRVQPERPIVPLQNCRRRLETPGPKDGCGGPRSQRRPHHRKCASRLEGPKRQRMAEKSSPRDEAKMHPPQASKKTREFGLPEVSFVVNINNLNRGGGPSPAKPVSP
jgi:hypothetical protein